MLDMELHTHVEVVLRDGALVAPRLVCAVVHQVSITPPVRALSHG